MAIALYLGVVPGALGYAMFARGLRDFPAREVTTLALAGQLTVAALAAIVLGAWPDVPALLGGALIVAGLAVPAAPPARLGRVSARPPDFMALLFEPVVAREAHPSRGR